MMQGGLTVTVTSRIYGHDVYWDTARRVWLYQDTDEIASVPSMRPCPKCSELPTPEGHDACLGTIVGAKFACCGHGVEEGYVSWGTGEAYVQFSVFSFTIFGWTFELTRRRPAQEDEAASGWIHA